MIVTTAGRTNEDYINKAKIVANDLGVRYVPRKKRSLSALHTTHQNIVVVGKDGIQLYHKDSNEPYFFHPNVAMIRVKRLLKGEQDPLIDVSGLGEGDSFLDCTLGNGSDSLVASLVVGHCGSVVGIESSNALAYVTKEGLQSWGSDLELVNEAMRRIVVVNEDHFSYLQKQPSNSVDVIYFDPMFEETIEESNGLRAMSAFTSYTTITTETIAEARRVARKRIILKDHFRSTRFSNLGFHQHIRKTSKFHYGTIEL